MVKVMGSNSGCILKSFLLSLKTPQPIFNKGCIFNALHRNFLMPLCFKTLKACFQGMNNGTTRFQLVLFPCLVILHVQCWSRSHMDGACQLFTMLVLTNFITFKFVLFGLMLQSQLVNYELRKNLAIIN